MRRFATSEGKCEPHVFLAAYNLLVNALNQKPFKLKNKANKQQRGTAESCGLETNIFSCLEISYLLGKIKIFRRRMP